MKIEQGNPVHDPRSTKDKPGPGATKSKSATKEPKGSQGSPNKVKDRVSLSSETRKASKKDEGVSANFLNALGGNFSPKTQDRKPVEGQDSTPPKVSSEKDPVGAPKSSEGPTEGQPEPAVAREKSTTLSKDDALSVLKANQQSSQSLLSSHNKENRGFLQQLAGNLTGSNATKESYEREIKARTSLQEDLQSGKISPQEAIEREKQLTRSSAVENQEITTRRIETSEQYVAASKTVRDSTVGGVAALTTTLTGGNVVLGTGAGTGFGTLLDGVSDLTAKANGDDHLANNTFNLNKRVDDIKTAGFSSVLAGANVLGTNALVQRGVGQGVASVVTNTGLAGLTSVPTLVDPNLSAQQKAGVVGLNLFGAASGTSNNAVIATTSQLASSLGQAKIRNGEVTGADLFQSAAETATSIPTISGVRNRTLAADGNPSPVATHGESRPLPRIGAQQSPPPSSQNAKLLSNGTPNPTPAVLEPSHQNNRLLGSEAPGTDSSQPSGPSNQNVKLFGTRSSSQPQRVNGSEDFHQALADLPEGQYLNLGQKDGNLVLNQPVAAGQEHLEGLQGIISKENGKLILNPNPEAAPIGLSYPDPSDPRRVLGVWQSRPTELNHGDYLQFGGPDGFPIIDPQQAAHTKLTPNAKVHSRHGIQVEELTPVSAKFLEQIHQGLDSIPGHLRDKLAAHGEKVAVGHLQADGIAPEQIGQPRRGYVDDQLGEGFGGGHRSPVNRRAVIPEYYFLDGPSGQPLKYHRAADQGPISTEGIVRHELGHSLDGIEGHSSGDEFIRRYRHDLQNVDNSDGFFDYYLTGTPLHSHSGSRDSNLEHIGRQEAFAEIFNRVLGADPKTDPFFRGFPGVVDYIQQKVIRSPNS